MRLYLITHAVTTPHRAADATTWSLAPAGQMQADILAEQPFWAEVDGVVLSSEQKTRLTVAPLLTSRSLPIYVDARFDELRRGSEWIEDYAAQVRAVFADPQSSIGKWESAATAMARFREGIADLCQNHREETLALVGHGLTFSLYRAYLLGRHHVDFADWQQLSFAAVALVDPVREHILQDFQAVAGELHRG